MTTSPLISIVLPTYNGARYLRAAIESCLAQTYPHWELILVDDASTDATPQVIAAACSADPRIRSIRNAANRKLPASLNRGFAEARGEFFTWTSDDNLYRPRALEEMLRFLTASPAVDLVYTDYTIIDANGLETEPGYAGSLDKLPFDSPVGFCFLYRRRVHEELGGYSEDLFLVEDWDFWLRASTRFRLEPLHQDLYLYRAHSGSLTATKVESFHAAYEKCLARNLPQLRWMSRSLSARAFRHLVSLAVARRDRRCAWTYVVSAVRHDPLIILRWELDPFAYLLLPGELYRIVSKYSPANWKRQLGLATREILKQIPSSQTFILADEGQWGIYGMFHGRHCVPLPEHEGQYWGKPQNDQRAIAEVKRLWNQGAHYLVFGWPAFNWLDYYPDLYRYLDHEFQCIARNSRVIIFEMSGKPARTREANESYRRSEARSG